MSNKAAIAERMRVSPLILRWGRNLGLGTEEVCLAAGLAPAEAVGGFSFGQTMRVWDAIESLSGDPLCGLVAGERFTLDQMGPVGPAVAACENVDAAIDTLVQLLRAFAPHAPVRRSDEDGAAGIAYRMPRTHSRHGVDTTLAAVLCVLRSCTQTSLAPTVLEHQFGAVQPERYRRLFGIEPRWSCSSCRILFPREALALPFRGAMGPMAALLRREAKALLWDPSGGAEAPLEHAFWTAHHGPGASLGHVAAELGVSPRTLQRRLRGQGMTFRELRAGLLVRRANQLLGTPGLSLRTIAERLGYDSREAFGRAFRRWTGHSPRRSTTSSANPGSFAP
ncbi:MAG: helix-turn-helix domain-containing protein [Sandaracinaceae bacterium]